MKDLHTMYVKTMLDLGTLDVLKPSTSPSSTQICILSATVVAHNDPTTYWMGGLAEVTAVRI